MSTKTYTSKSGHAFSNDGKNAGYRAIVDSDGTIRVWDSVAGHYTMCHSLTQRQIANIRAKAK